jgi:hypothetical protein
VWVDKWSAESQINRQINWAKWRLEGVGLNLSINVSSELVQFQVAAGLNGWGINNRAASGGDIGAASWSTNNNTQPIFGVDRTANTNGVEFMYAPKDWTIQFIVDFGQVVPVGDEIKFTVAWETWNAPGETFLNSTGNGTIPAGARSAAVVVSLSNANWWFRPISVTFDIKAPATFTITSLAPSIYVAVANVDPVSMVFTPAVSQPGIVQFVGHPATVYYPGFLPLADPINFQHSPIPWQATRTTAVSALFTNVSKVLNKEGTVLWGHVNPSYASGFIIPLGVVSTLSPLEKAYLPLETGTYTYVPPSTDLAEYFDYHVLSFSNGTVPVYRLDNTASVNVGFFTDSDVTTPTALAVNADWHLEFRNSTALFPIAISPMPLELLHQAQVIMAGTGFFFPNSLHRKILDRLLRYRDVITRVAGAVNPLLGSAVAGVYEAFASGSKSVVKASVKKNSTTPKATSGQASGIVADMQPTIKYPNRAPRASRMRPRPQGTRSRPRPRTRNENYARRLPPYR